MPRLARLPDIFRAPSGRALRLGLRLGLLLPVLTGAVVSCDPCVGVGACNGDPRVAFEGQFIVHWDGAPVPGVKDTFVRTGGVDLAADTLHATTNAEGRYHIEVAAATEGTVEGYIEVAAPSRPPFRVDDLTFHARRARGEGDVLGIWVAEPYFPYVGEVYSRATGQPLVGAKIEFRRTGGIDLYGLNWVDDAYRTETTAGGRFNVLLYAYPRGEGEVTGDITVRPADGSGPFVIPDVRLTSTHVAYEPPIVARWGIGASLRYVGELHKRGTEKRAAGVHVRFQRTGGIEASPETFEATTDENGRFPIFLTSTRDGVVIGKLTLQSPGSSKSEIIDDVHIPTFDTDEVRLLGVWGVGYSFNYVGELVWQNDYSHAAGVEVEFHRTGGVMVEPETFTVTTDAYGRFPLMPEPLAEGEVTFDLHVQPPAPAQAFVIKDVRMSTTYADQAALLAVWGIPGSGR